MLNAQFLKHVSTKKVTDWLNCKKNDIIHPQLTGDEIIQNVSNTVSLRGGECDESGNGFSKVSHTEANNTFAL